jgi:hypothetical protein
LEQELTRDGVDGHLSRVNVRPKLAREAGAEDEGFTSHRGGGCPFLLLATLDDADGPTADEFLG